jgi:hypothetical protein
VTPAEALAFVCTHRSVLESGSGPVPSLAAAIAGEPIRGSWWAHARGREIFTVTRAIRVADRAESAFTVRATERESLERSQGPACPRAAGGQRVGRGTQVRLVLPM